MSAGMVVRWWTRQSSPYANQRYMCHRGVLYIVNGTLTYMALEILGPRGKGKVVTGVGKKWYGPGPGTHVFVGKTGGSIVFVIRDECAIIGKVKVREECNMWPGY